MSVIGIGLANMDLVAYVKDEFLLQHKVQKGFAQKIDDLPFARLRSGLSHYDAIAGGCAANTICGLAASGVDTQFFGKVGEDSFESLYRSAFKEYSVSYNVQAGSQETSQCAVLVTPDGERTFAYTHGASWDLDGDDLDINALENATLICTEIYLFEFGKNSSTARVVFDIAERKKVPLVMKAMDQDFGQRYGQKIKALANAGILGLVVGNHENLPSVTGTHNLESAIHALKGWKCDSLITANKNGAYYVSGGEVTHYPITPVDNPKNTTGAGDQFLAGFLMGRLDNKPVADCMEFAAATARAILMHDTARPPLAGKQGMRF